MNGCEFCGYANKTAGKTLHIVEETEPRIFISMHGSGYIQIFDGAIIGKRFFNMTQIDKQKKALEWFKNHYTTCADCPKCFDFTCSGADSNRCLAYREAIAALQTALCKAEHESAEITRPDPWPCGVCTG